MLGGSPVAGRDDIVDEAAGATGGVATIFSGDERVATSVRKPDGSRAISIDSSGNSVSAHRTIADKEISTEYKLLLFVSCRQR